MLKQKFLIRGSRLLLAIYLMMLVGSIFHFHRYNLCSRIEPLSFEISQSLSSGDEANNGFCFFEHFLQTLDFSGSLVSFDRFVLSNEESIKFDESFHLPHQTIFRQSLRAPPTV